MFAASALSMSGVMLQNVCPLLALIMWSPSFQMVSKWDVPDACDFASFKISASVFNCDATCDANSGATALP